MPQSLVKKKFHCTEQAWLNHEAELRRFVTGKTANHAHADDVIQEVFLRALQQGAPFCSLTNPRAWLFSVCRNVLVDYWRKDHRLAALPDDFDELFSEETRTDTPLNDLLDCIEPNLAALLPSDQVIIRACDLAHQTVQQFADEQGLTLAAAKSRLLRARIRLRAAMVARCGVQFDEQHNVCCRTDSPCS